MYHWQRVHIIDELLRYGHIVETFNPLSFLSIDEANETVISIIKNRKDIDLFLACDSQSILYGQTVKEISNMGLPTCLICWDNLELPYKHRYSAPYFDIVWLTSKETKNIFKKWGCKKIIFQTYAANPFVFKPNWGIPIQTIGFVGSPYGSRVNKINRLLCNNIPCSVYSDMLFNKGYNTSLGKVHKYKCSDVMVKGLRYMRFPIGRKVLYAALINKIINNPKIDNNNLLFHGYHSVSNDEMIQLYSNFALSLNITELRDTYILKNPVHKIHLRCFEIPMSGGLQFASYSPELAGYFEEDKEIVLYRSNEEMIDKARFYLNPQNQSIVLKMKKSARIRAVGEHTWIKRFERIFELI